MPGKYWNKEIEDRLRELSATGSLSAADIGLELGMTRDSVIAKMQRMGIPSLYNSVKTKMKIKNKIAKKEKTYRKGEHNRPNTRFMSHPSFHNPTETSKKMIDLGIGECRWPCYEENKLAILFCANHAEGVYCQEHLDLSLNK